MLDQSAVPSSYIRERSTNFCPGSELTYRQTLHRAALEVFQPSPNEPRSMQNHLSGVNRSLTNAVSSCGLEISFGAIVPSFEGICFLLATGVLSLSASEDLDGVAGTLRGCAEGISSGNKMVDGKGESRPPMSESKREQMLLHRHVSWTSARYKNFTTTSSITCRTGDL